MKKIVILLLSYVFILGCSSDDENHSNELTQKLIGSWKTVGVYDHEYDDHNPEPQVRRPAQESRQQRPRNSEEDGIQGQKRSQHESRFSTVY